MQSSSVEIPTSDGLADAYLTLPDDGDRHRGVLLVTDAFGLRPRIEEMADHIAEHGYAVLAPNVFYRAGRSPVLPFSDLSAEDGRAEFFRTVRPLMDELTPAHVAADGEAYLDKLSEVADEPFAVLGYCMGARLGWRIAASQPERVVALAGFHAGGLVTVDRQSPHHSAGSLRGEVYLGHADNDPSMTPEQIATLNAALEEGGVTHSTEVYAGARHGYTMRDTPAYDEQACERHFAALFELLERTLGR